MNGEEDIIETAVQYGKQFLGLVDMVEVARRIHEKFPEIRDGDVGRLIMRKLRNCNEAFKGNEDSSKD